MLNPGEKNPKLSVYMCRCWTYDWLELEEMRLGESKYVVIFDGYLCRLHCDCLLQISVMKSNIEEDV
jgi:hypothetical protein